MQKINSSDSQPQKSLLVRALIWGRDLRAKSFVKAVREHSKGEVIDVGGGDFYLTAKRQGVSFSNWTTVEIDRQALLGIENSCTDEKFKIVLGDGCDLSKIFPSETFDTLINSQVLEHVFEPNQMVKESARLLKKNGVGIFLIPQTSVVHMVPNHYYNFTRFWIERAMKEAGFEILQLKSIGGVWTSHASHMVFLPLKLLRMGQLSYPEAKRNFLFWILLPFSLVFSVFSFFVSLVLGLGDFTEEPNNHIVVVRKK